MQSPQGEVGWKLFQHFPLVLCRKLIQQWPLCDKGEEEVNKIIAAHHQHQQ